MLAAAAECKIANATTREVFKAKVSTLWREAAMGAWRFSEQ